MFGFLTWIKIGAVVAALAVCGFFYWNYHHMQTQIVNLKDEIEGLKTRAEIIEKAQKATDEYLKKRTAIQRKAASVKTKVDTVVESGDDAGMRNLFIERGLLTPRKTGNPPGR